MQLSRAEQALYNKLVEYKKNGKMDREFFLAPKMSLPGRCLLSDLRYDNRIEVAGDEGMITNLLLHGFLTKSKRSSHTYFLNEIESKKAGSGQILRTRDPDYPGAAAWIAKHFNKSELKNLSYNLNIPYAELSGSVHMDKTRELIEYALRFGCVDDLIEEVKKARPRLAQEFGSFFP